MLKSNKMKRSLANPVFCINTAFIHECVTSRYCNLQTIFKFSTKHKQAVSASWHFLRYRNILFSTYQC